MPLRVVGIKHSLDFWQELWCLLHLVNNHGLHERTFDEPSRIFVRDVKQCRDVKRADFTIDFGAFDLSELSSDTVSIQGIDFIGSYISTILPALTEGDGGRFYYYDIIDTTSDCLIAQLSNEISVVGALRAYLIVRWDDPINHGGPKGPTMKKMEIYLLDDGTGIDEIQNSKFKVKNEEGCVIYDLSGRKIATGKSFPLKGVRGSGIYIVNGKKFVK